MTVSTKKIRHNDGKVGGYLVGRRHSAGGIKARNVDSGEPLEVESDEVIITRQAVLSDQKHDFNGRQMTNLEILSMINQQGGGVALLEEGGRMQDSLACHCTGQKHRYNGQELSDREIVAAMEEGGKTGSVWYSFSGVEEIASELYRELLQLKATHIDNRYDTKPEDPGIEAKLTNAQWDELFPWLQNKDIDKEISVRRSGFALYQDGELQMKEGGHTCGCQHHLPTFPAHLYPHAHPHQYKGGGTVPARPKKEKVPVTEGEPFKGIDHAYANPYELNRAIESLLDKRPEGDLTPEEKAFLRYYSGSGGLEKYGASGVGLLYEYYTPPAIARVMWGLAYKYGYQGGAILEPSCGTGEFFNYAPDDAPKTGYEINPYSARIARILHPSARIEEKHFEEVFLQKRSSIRSKIDHLPRYQLVIGNPPYGDFQGLYAGMGEKTYTRASNYIDYFLLRGLDLVEPGGLLIYLIGAEVAAGGVPFLAQQLTPVKQEISQKADLLDAYRLPNGVFDRTDVLTDIVVFKKL